MGESMAFKRTQSRAGNRNHVSGRSGTLALKRIIPRIWRLGIRSPTERTLRPLWNRRDAKARPLVAFEPPYRDPARFGVRCRGPGGYWVPPPSRGMTLETLPLTPTSARTLWVIRSLRAGLGILSTVAFACLTHPLLSQSFKYAIARPFYQFTDFPRLDEALDLRFWSYPFHRRNEFVPKRSKLVLRTEIHIT
jgi:hypothetical protein